MNMYHKILMEAQAIRKQRKEKQATTYHAAPPPAKWELAEKARALFQELQKK